MVSIVHGALFRRFGAAWGNFFYPQGEAIFGEALAERVWKNGDDALAEPWRSAAECLLFLAWMASLPRLAMAHEGPRSRQARHDQEFRYRVPPASPQDDKLALQGIRRNVSNA